MCKGSVVEEMRGRIKNSPRKHSEASRQVRLGWDLRSKFRPRLVQPSHSLVVLAPQSLLASVQHMLGEAVIVQM
jgi:hypothetical protein